MNEQKPKPTTNRILIIVSIVLLLAVIFLSIPYFQGEVDKHDAIIFQEGINYVVGFMLNELIEKGYTQIPYGNQTITLVPYQEEKQ